MHFVVNLSLIFCFNILLSFGNLVNTCGKAKKSTTEQTQVVPRLKGGGSSVDCPHAVFPCGLYIPLVLLHVLNHSVT